MTHGPQPQLAGACEGARTLCLARANTMPHITLAQAEAQFEAFLACQVQYFACIAAQAVKNLGDAGQQFVNTQIGPYTIGQWVLIGITIYVVVQILPVLVLAPLGI